MESAQRKYFFAKSAAAGSCFTCCVVGKDMKGANVEAHSSAASTVEGKLQRPSTAKTVNVSVRDGVRPDSVHPLIQGANWSRRGEKNQMSIYSYQLRYSL